MNSEPKPPSTTEPASTSIHNLVIYQCFVRNHTPDGQLAGVTADLGRIEGLGVDVLYLMPIHPIGEVGRKGTLGSPYAIRDFRAIDPELGNEQDLVDLIRAAHERGMRVIIDVVFHHTSPDSVLAAEHPEYFRQDAQGRPVSSVPEWSDIIDLLHPNPALSRYLIDSLAHWVRLGIDGFRCDVASLMPLELWTQARAELATITPDLLWLAETPHPGWIAERRERGQIAYGDPQMYDAFDIEYQYDLWSIWQAAVLDQVPVERFLEMLRWQDATLPTGAAKLRYVENHDNFRVMRFAKDRDQALAWTALMAFAKGPLMIYAGQESGADTWPSLFNRDPIAWGDYELSGVIAALAKMKKHPAMAEGVLRWVAADPVVVGAWLPPADSDTPALVGHFAVGAQQGGGSSGAAEGPARGRILVDVASTTGGDTPESAVRVVETRSAEDLAEPPITHVHSQLLDNFWHVEAMDDEAPPA